MWSRFDELLTDQQLGAASTDQIDDLVDRIDKMLQSRGSQESCAVSDGLPEPFDPADPNTA
jgi:hypothetical protein